MNLKKKTCKLSTLTCQLRQLLWGPNNQLRINLRRRRELFLVLVQVRESLSSLMTSTCLLPRNGVPNHQSNCLDCSWIEKVCTLEANGSGKLLKTPPWLLVQLLQVVVELQFHRDSLVFSTCSAYLNQLMVYSIKSSVQSWTISLQLDSPTKSKHLVMQQLIQQSRSTTVFRLIYVLLPINSITCSILEMFQRLSKVFVWSSQ